MEINRLLWIVENFFTEELNGERFHEVGFYYLLNLKDEKLLENGCQFTREEGENHKLMFRWTPLEEVQKLKLYPLFLKGKILNMPQAPEHIIEIKNDLL